MLLVVTRQAPGTQRLDASGVDTDGFNVVIIVEGAFASATAKIAH